MTDWWMFWATLFAGIFSALATWFAVVYTNNKTAERYEKEKERQEKANAIVILKPVLMLTTLEKIWEDLIIKNIWDRVLFLPRDDEFGHFCDNTMAWKGIRLLSIRNENQNNVRLLKITLDSNLTVGDNESDKINFSKIYFIKFLRSREEILVPLYGNLQEEKIYANHENEIFYDLTFNCKIEYLTWAKQQINYEYNGKITSKIKIAIGKKDSVEEKYSYPEHSVIIVKDEPSSPSDKCTLNENSTASSFINLQDHIAHVDRINYVHRKIGEAQVQGIVGKIGESEILNDLLDRVDRFFNKKPE